MDSVLLAGFGNLLGGGFSGFLMRRGAPLSSARKISITVFAALMCAAIPAVLVRDVSFSISFVSLAMLGYTGCCANILAVPSDVFPESAVGSVYGFASMGSGFGGMVFTLLTGWAVDRVSYVPVKNCRNCFRFIRKMYFSTNSARLMKQGNHLQHKD
jgi:ACS family hexuronate transporter-like MFS transporter